MRKQNVSRRKRRVPVEIVRESKPYYTTTWGSSYLGDARNLLEQIEDEKIDLIITSPPFALTQQKRYGQKFDFVDTDYGEWFEPFAKHLHRILKPRGSLVIHVGGSWKQRAPIKSLYNFKLLLSLCNDVGFTFAQDFYWFNSAKLPSPAQWVAVRRIRAKDAVDPVWWLCKDKRGRTKANNKNVQWQYSEAMLSLLRRATYNFGPRPSGYRISSRGFLVDNGGAISPNLLPYPNTESNGSYLKACRKYGLEVNPARFPVQIPEFFIRLLTRRSNIVLDPFAGSNTTGYAAEKLHRRWISFEIYEEYVKGSSYRFFSPDHESPPNN